MRIQEVWNSDEIKKYFMSKENYILVNGETRRSDRYKLLEYIQES